jgi:hypothetical protein
MACPSSRFALLVLLLIFNAAPASACRGPLQSFEENLAMAGTVFVGRISAVKAHQAGPNAADGEGVAITFVVERYWKGEESAAVTVFAGTDSCGFARGGQRTVGEKWLILASAGPRVSTSLLSGNVWLEDEHHRSMGQKIPAQLGHRLGNGHVPRTP